MKRTVQIGVMTYIGPAGVPMFAMHGEEVNVQPGDVERFDRLNGTPMGVQAVDEERPAGNASLEAWQEYAAARGVEVNGLSRDEIRAKF